MIEEAPFLVAIMFYLGCALLLAAYTPTIGYLLRLLASVLDHSYPIVGRIFHTFAVEVENLDSFIRSSLGQGMLASKWAFAKILHAHVVLWQEATEALDDLAGRTGHWIRNVAPGAMLAIATGFFLPWRWMIHWAVKQIHALQRLGVHTSHVVTHTVTHELPVIRQHITKVYHVTIRAAPYAVAGVHVPAIPRIGPLERDVANIEKRLNHLSRKLALPALVGLVGVALGRLGLRWTRCEPMKKYGNRVCNMDSDLLDALLADTLLVLGTVDLVEFSKELGTVVGYVAKETHRFWRVA